MRVVAGLRAFILAALFFLTLSAEAHANKRVALVIGNSTYQNVPQLPNPSRDAVSIAQMLRSREIIVIVPDARKANAVKGTLESEISPAVPASILRTHEHVTLFLDEPAASLLEPATRARYRHG